MKGRSGLVICLFGLLYLAEIASAQSNATDQSSTPTELTNAKKKGYFKIAWRQPYPNPYRSAIYSLVLPGSGQIYNKRYWKAPIVWGGFVALIKLVQFNKQGRDQFGTAYGLEVAGLEHEFTGIIRDAETLRRIRNSYDKNLQLSYVGFFGMYAITALDAYVDGHLKSFDMNEDLSLTIKPMFNGYQNGIGIGLVLRPAD
ncbi:MAG: hypothetical protein IPL46_31505 [Saprospiraceae bacterium]|nr:hypothetical protein [Saprospiraceae bacterium]